MNAPFTPIHEAIELYAQGHMLIMVDDEERENEGDIVFAAQHSTPEKINFMATHARGLVCVAGDEKRLAALDLAPVPPDRNTALLGTNFTDSVDARHGVSTGISAFDRNQTVQVLANPDSHPSDLGRPGHIFPIAARPGGVLKRAGHTEGSVDLARLGGLEPFGVLCEIMNEDGTMARLNDLVELSKRFDLPLVTIKDLIAHRRRHEKLIRKEACTVLPNRFGQWRLTLYEDVLSHVNHLAIAMGEIGPEPILVRMHSQCFTGDTLGSLRCDCGPQLQTAMETIAKEGRGVIVYLHQEGRGIGLKNKILAYTLQDEGLDTVEANEHLGFKADLREYGIGAQVLVDLGVSKIRLMTNNPRKIVGVEAYGLDVVERVPLEVGRGDHNDMYLETKRCRLGHMISDGGRK